MSGGSYDYAYHRVGDLADAIDERAVDSSCEDERRAFAERLRLCAAAAKAIEWTDSGDSARGSERGPIAAAMGKPEESGMSDLEEVVIPENLVVIDFCPGCFASEDNGSWGDGTYGQWCANCGSNGTVKLPRWAVESIRRQASWVGKRYYPADEDRQNARELRYLRTLAPLVTPLDQSVVSVLPVENDRGEPTRYSAARGGITIFSFDTPTSAVEDGGKSLPFPVPDDFEPIPTKAG